MRTIGVFFVISGLLLIFFGSAMLVHNFSSSASEVIIYLNIVAILSGVSTALSGLRMCDE